MAGPRGGGNGTRGDIVIKSFCARLVDLGFSLGVPQFEVAAAGAGFASTGAVCHPAGATSSAERNSMAVSP